jgi:hypothetical protein
MPFQQIANEIRDLDVTAIALDERSMEYLAYREDGTLQGRYPIDDEEAELLMRDLWENDIEEREASTSCVQLTSDDVQKCEKPMVLRPP